MFSEITDNLKSASLMLAQRFKPYHKYKGNHEQIAKSIIKNCWNGEFFQVSNGHFQNYYNRDFGMCVSSLMRLGYKKECRQTAKYALTKFKEQNKVTTTIDHTGKCVDFFAYGPDSLAFFLNVIVETKLPLLESDKRFLTREAIRCKELVWDSIRNKIKNTYFSKARDHYKHDASCYDFCMLGWIDAQLKVLKLDSPFDIDFKGYLLRNYWDKEKGGFYDDLSQDDFSSDAQWVPFYTGLVKDKKLFLSALQLIQDQKLDEPFPIKYAKKSNKKKELFWPSLAAPNYEGNATWIHTGLCYMQTVAKFDTKLAGKYVGKYRRLIEHHKNFLEVYDEKGEPYKTLLYKSDESMLWVSVYLDLHQQLFSQ